MTSEMKFQASGMEMTLRRVKCDELVQVAESCNQLDWHYNNQDLKLIFDVCPESFIGAYCEDGTLVCNIIAMPVDGNLAYIGCFATQKEHRGKGIGKVVFNEALKFLKGRNVQLDSVESRRKMFTKFGLTSSQQVTFFLHGKIHDADAYEFPTHLEIRDVKADNYCDISSYDFGISTIDRSDHLPHQIISSCSKVLGAFDNDRCVGYGSVEMFKEDTFMFKTLYCDSSSIATALIQSFLCRGWITEGSTVYMYPLLQNKEKVSAVARQFGIATFDSYPIYRFHLKEEKNFEWSKIFSSAHLLNTVI